MKHVKIMSYGAKTNIYHKPGCRYTKMIKPENFMAVSNAEMKHVNGRICRYCNSMNHHYRMEEKTMDYYERNKNMEFKYTDGILYVKTSISCWKLVYCRGEKKLALYHRNCSGTPVDFEKPQLESYHRQEDVPYGSSIGYYLNYIFEHDKYREAEMKGEKILHFSSKKYEKRAAKSKRKKEIQRVDHLFAMLEAEHAGYRKLSYC